MWVLTHAAPWISPLWDFASSRRDRFPVVFEIRPSFWQQGQRLQCTPRRERKRLSIWSDDRQEAPVFLAEQPIAVYARNLVYHRHRHLEYRAGKVYVAAV